MAAIPHSWEAYARLQERLTKTTNIKKALAMEAALDVVHRADFQPAAFTDEVLKGVADTAGRRERDRVQLLCRFTASQHNRGFATNNESAGTISDAFSQSLDDQVHAASELSRLQAKMQMPDWRLLVGVATGASYEELSVELATSSGALRSRVCRLRQMIA